MPQTLTIFEREQLLKLAESFNLKKQTVQIPPIMRVERRERVPLSFAQQRLWFLAQIEGVSEVYHSPIALRLKGELNTEALRRALDRIVARHEALRTTFTLFNDEPVQRITSADLCRFCLSEHDLRHRDDAQGQMECLMKQEMQQSFDLEAGPLIRGRLIQLDEQEHILLLTQHHIVSDGWSLGIFARELGALYSAFSRQQPDPLPPLPIQYPDYAAWQQQWLSGERLEKQVAYWRETLAGAPVLLELPTDRPRPPEPSFAGAYVPIQIERELTGRLKQLSGRQGTTLFMTLLAAWGAVLSRLSGQDDVVIGTPTAGRQYETEGLIGFFINTLALRVDLRNEPGVAELLARVRSTALAGQDHQDLPFEQVVEIVQPPRRLNHTPLFQVMFAWQNHELDMPDMAGLRVEPVETAYGVARFDLKLDLYEEGEFIVGSLNYATALFDEATIKRQIGYLLAMLKAMVTDSEQAVAGIDLLSAEERVLQLETWNATAVPYREEACIHELFEEQVRKAREAVAVVYEDESLSYGELNERANRLAHYLIDMGVKPDDRVAICVERTLAMVVGLLAILKAGGAYVPLDPEYPSERLRQILADAAPAIVLSDAVGYEALGAGALEGLRVIDVEGLGQAPEHRCAWAEQPSTNTDARQLGLTSRHLAYVIYTSGSTGMPKGVMIEHRSVINFHRAMMRSISRLRSSSLRFGWNASFSFDMSIKGFSQLMSGHCLVLIPQQVRASGSALLGFLKRESIDAFDTTPSQLKVMIADGFLQEKSRKRRTVLVGGEPIDPSMWLHLRGCRSIKFHNMYGPTECTVDATIGEVQEADEVSHGGRPIANTRIYILDEQRKPVPLGAVGEIYIGGAGVARGYLNRPELTGERFVPDGYSGVEGGRMYKTGDLARYQRDGNIEFLGRNDFQVKIRGFRIELGEIEARLGEHAGVGEVAVVVREDEPGEKRLVAYYTRQGGEEGAGEVSAQGLREHVAVKLPEYMVPTAFVRVEGLPLTANGKLDRKALPAPEGEAYAQRGYEEPQGETEETLARLWQELLGVERVGRHDHFFELGGHSLLAVQLLVRMRQVLGVELAMARLFAHPTLHELAHAVSELGAVEALPAITRVSREDPLLLSFAQQRLWFLAQSEDVSVTYHIPIGLRLRGELDRLSLQQSLNAVFARHEVLRTVFVTIDGEPMVELLPAEMGLQIVEHDLREEADAEERVKQLALEEARTPFDLSRGPLIRGRLIHLQEQEYVFLLTQHHIVSDGWSLGVLTLELGELYRAFRRQEPSPLKPLPIQYADFAAWQRRWLSGERQQRDVDYWREALAGVPALLELPTDRPRPPRQSFAGAYVPISIDGELMRALNELSSQHGLTLFMTILAAWAAVLARLSGQEDVIIATPTANRRRQETEGLIGFFVNTLALRVDLCNQPSVGELLARVRKAALAAQDHQDLPFEQVVEIVQPPRTLNYTPLFQVMFVWQNDERSALKLPDLDVEKIAPAYQVAKYDLRLNLYEQGESILGGLNYATALFDEGTIRRHIGYLLKMLRAMVADPGQAVGGIDLLSAEERVLQLETWNATTVPYREEACVHELFEEQVRKAREAVAVAYEDESLSYGELNERANRLAHYLIDMGVKPDDRVAICVERSLAMVVGVLAILKAGGAYVPLDPVYPVERLRYMLEDSQPVAFLTQAHLGERFSGLSAALPVVDLSSAVAPWSNQLSTNPNARARGLSSRHLAYVIYTSGSTGMPKGVMGFHKPLISLIEWVTKQFSVSSEDVLLLTTSLSFDLSVYDIFGMLVAGGSLRIASQKDLTDPRRLAQILFERPITFWDSAPAVFKQVIPYLGEAGSCDREPSLRLAFYSGDWIPLDFFGVLRQYFPHCQMIGLGGATEATVWSNFFPVNHIDSNWASVPYGKPIQNARYYILDNDLNPLPLGKRGELYIGGDCVTAGYLNRPELTGERFVQDPYSGVEGGRMYKTGDLARYQRDGNIEFLGRNDFQVKIRGFRIELGEIEARLGEHAGVGEVAVVVREDEPGEKRLVAYYTRQGGEEGAGEVSAQGLREHVAVKLPEYMVPAAFVRVEGLPLTPNGKLDRKALPAPEGEAYAQRGYEEPQGETEETLARLWQELLGVERVGRHDHFFELGGHSLLVVQLMERLRRLNLHMEVRALFATPVLYQLAAALSQHHEVPIPPNVIRADSAEITPEMLPLIDLTQEEIDSIIERVPGGMANIQDIYALSPLQDGILFHHLVASEGDPYLMSGMATFPDRALLQRFLSAVQEVVDRHDILRTAFIWEGLSKPVQVVLRRARLSVREVELDAEQGPVAEQLARRFDPRRHRMDLRQAPLLDYAIAYDRNQDRWVVMHRLHHLIGDHSTLNVLRAEVSVLLRGEMATSSPQPFRNLVAQMRLGGSKEEQERFFREMLGDVSEPTLPFGLSNVHQEGGEIMEGRRMMPQRLNDRLRKQARRVGVSLASLCHLAWGQVLARSSGCERVVFGTVLFGRMGGSEGADQAVGLFINTLPLRLDMDNRAMATAVRETHARLAELLRHEHASLVLAQRCSGVAAPTPLFSAILNYRHNVVSAVVADDVRNGDPLAGVEFLGSQERSNYPFTLSIEDFEESLGLTALVVQPLSAERVCGYMQQALESLVVALETDPDLPVRELEILPAEERVLQLETWNATAVPYREEACIHELFEEQVRKTPEAVAVVYEDESLSYGELNERANRLAHYLIDMGIKPDDRVAICVERSLAMVVGVLAILKAGGAYVPLDPVYPVERLRYMLEDSQPVALLTQAHLGERFSGLSTTLPVVDLSSAVEQWNDQPSSNPDRNRINMSPENLAYVIYTSGSTGTPKGVMVRHRGLCNLVNAQIRAFAIDHNSRVLQFASFSFDAFAWELCMALCNGASLNVVGDAGKLVGESLSQILKEKTISHATLSPAVLATLRESVELESLHTLIVAGDAFVGGLLKHATSSRRLINAYGPTEVTVCASLHECQPENPGNPPIGRPIANARIYILDEQRKPVPLGAVGEIYIGGAGVARGYLNRPELTGERFVQDPYSGVEGGRMYKTGDLARYQRDGNIEFLGRNDFQVKIRGFRIELGEIEARLGEHAGVGEVAVVVREDEPGEKRLVAYYTRQGGEEGAGEVSAQGLREHVAVKLPEYMVPAAFVRVEGLPLTPNGKLDRKALPAPEGEAYAQRGYEEPQGETEETLARLWQELLGVERVGRHDHFFELGGHSLLVVQLMERLRRLNLHMEVRALFATPVLYQLAAALSQHHEVPIPPNVIRADSAEITPEMLPLIDLTQEEIDSIIERVPGGMANIQDIYALSPLQDGILFHHLVASEGDPYLMSGMATFPDRALLQRFLSAVQEVVDRHDILRTAFIWEGLSKPVQVVLRRARLSVREVELDAEQGPVAEQLARRFDPRRHRMDLRQAPLLDYAIAYDRNQDRWVVMHRLHHLIGDHFTLDALRGEVRVFLVGEGQSLVPSPAFRNLVAQMRLGVSQEEQERFFREMLGDVSEPTLPFGLSNVHQEGGEIMEGRRMMPQRLNDRLRKQARRVGVSLASLCHLAWGQVLARSSGCERVVFGTVLFGRMGGSEGADQAVGLFINTLPLRLDMDSRATATAVRETHARLAELLMHEHSSLALAQRCSGVTAPNPLFSALLNYRHNVVPVVANASAGDPLAGVEFLASDERTNYPVTLSVEDFGQGLGLTALVAQPLSAERVCGYMQQALESLVVALETAPDLPVRELEILPAEERVLQLETWNATAVPYREEACIHELFEEQVRKAPEAVAVVYEDESLSYGELNERANRLAHYLIDMGIKPDDRVAICVERSLAMVVGVLAILKAGGAYVPLDPVYPVERLRYMLEDSQPVALLTQAHLGERFSGLSTTLPVVDLSSAVEQWNDQPASNPDGSGVGVTAKHLAYVIYTSGSTGMPKGVMVEHAQVTRLFETTYDNYRFDNQDVWCMFHSLAFDFSVWEIWGALRYGGRLVIVPRESVRSVGDFCRLVCNEGVTILNQTPSAFKSFMGVHAESGLQHRLRYVIFGGEALEPSMLKSWYRRHSDRQPQLINMYGITETTVHVTYRPLYVGDGMQSGSPIGKRLADLRMYLLDKKQEPVPLGAVGEIYIGGAGVARGYLNRPELTGERFVPDGYSGVEGGRMYKTGDLARYQRDGNIEFLGRNDFQVKIRGFRIELGEIEARLGEHAGVGEVAVVVREDEPGEKRLVAYYTRQGGEEGEGEVSAQGLREHVGVKLPEYMVPAAFVRVEGLPLTANGKLDRKALPAPEGEAYAQRGYEEPQGETEETLARLWQELLGVERVGRHDHFFELGGHSLLVVQLMERLRRLNLHMEVRSLFMTPTLNEVASAINQIEELRI